MGSTKLARMPGYAEQQPDLYVRKVEIGPDEGPGGARDTVDQLVQELDGEERKEGCGGEADAAASTPDAVRVPGSVRSLAKLVGP